MLELRAFRCAGMIIFLVPIVGALTTRFSHFDMIHLGSYLSALSPLWIVAFPDHGALLRFSMLLPHGLHVQMQAAYMQRQPRGKVE